MAPRQAESHPEFGDSAPQRAGGERSDRADHHAVLSSDSASSCGTNVAPVRPCPAARSPSTWKAIARTPRFTCGGPLRCTSSSSARRRSECGRRKDPFRRISSRRSPRRGIEWIATDEEILSESTNGWISRDGQGHMRHPEMLYRPWRVESGDKSLHVIFRDHALSDLIGFHYQRSDPEHAAWRHDQQVSGDRPSGRGEQRGPRGARPRDSGRRKLLGILSGRRRPLSPGALSQLHSEPADSPAARPRLPQGPAADRPHRQPVCRQLDLPQFRDLDRPPRRQHRLGPVASDPRVSQADRGRGEGAQAKRWPRPGRNCSSPRGATGIWWFGDDHSSSQDALFDQLFRKHLQNVYTRLDTHSAERAQAPDQAAAAARSAHASRPGSARSKSTAGGPISSGSAPGTTSAAASAAR